MHQGTFFGHLGRNAEVRYTPGGTPVCNFPLGVKVKQGQQEHTLWVDCAIFGKRAESSLPQYLTQGTGVVVTGDIDVRTFQKRDQTMGAAISCQVQQLSFTGPSNSQQGGQNAAQNQGQNRPPQQPQNNAPQNNGGYAPPQNGNGMPEPVDDFDDDIPF